MSLHLLKRAIILTFGASVLISMVGAAPVLAQKSSRYDRRVIGLFGLGGRLMAPLNLKTSADTIDMSVSGELQLGIVLKHFEIYGLYSTSVLLGSASVWGGGMNFRVLDSGPYNTHEGELVPNFSIKLGLEYVKMSPAISEASKTIMRYGLGAAFRTGNSSYFEVALKAFSLGKVNIAPYFGFHFAFRGKKK